MSDFDEFDDFELDEETLRQIEEEAMREVEAEFKLDPSTMAEIEEAAKREAGLEGAEVNDELMAEIRSEAQHIAEDHDYSLDNFDLDLDLDDDLDLAAIVDDRDAKAFPKMDLNQAPMPEPAVQEPPSSVATVAEQPLMPPSGSAIKAPTDTPTPPTSRPAVQAPPPPLEAPEQGAKQRAVETAKKKARENARRKAKKKTVAQIAHVARERAATAGPHGARMEDIERDLGKKPSSIVIPVVVVSMAVFLGLLAGILIIVNNKKRQAENDEAQKNVTPIVQHTDPQGNPITAQEVEASKLYSQIRKIKKRSSLEDIEKGLEMLKEIRAKYPAYAQKKGAALKRKEEQFTKWRDVYKSMMQ